MNYCVGDISVTALHDGDFHMPSDGLVANAKGDDVTKDLTNELSASFFSPEALPITFIALLTRSRRTTLIDIGYGPPSTGRLMDRLRTVA